MAAQVQSRSLLEVTMRFSPVLAIVMALSCRPAPHAFDYSREVGVAVEKDGRVCLEIRNGSLAPGAAIALVGSSASAAAQVVQPDSSCPSGNPVDAEYQRYRLRLTAGTLAPSVPTIAIVGRPSSHDTYRSCSSSEGIHLTLWSGKPLASERRWHQYYYVGYDLEPDCTPADIAATLERK
jgi:hypothetical protein